MIKGVSRRVVVVKAPDPRFFEEAIFILREEALAKDGVTAEQVVDEARRVADGFTQKNRPAWTRHLPAAGYIALGALISTICWAVALVL